jgi:hypothetical protein
MKTLFKFTVLMLISSWSLQAQTETLYIKTYNTNENTTALLEFRGSSVEILESPDEKFYVEHTIEFINYPNRKKKAARERVKIESEFTNNQIKLVDKSKFNMYRFYQFNTIFGSMMMKSDKAVNSYNYKEQSIVLKEISEAKKPVSSYMRYIQNSTRYSESEKTKMIEKEKKRKPKKYISKLVIKVPNNLILTINSKASTIRIKENLDNQISLRADGGRLYVENLKNQNNVIKIKDATLIAKTINGGELILDNTKRTVIGELKNVKLSSEFSQLEIGKIASNVEITDFTSKYLIHNFSNDFEALNMITEYSEVNLFLPKNKGYQLTTFGNYTKHFVDNKAVDFPVEKNNNNTKMLDINTKGNDNSLSTISITTVNGIIRLTKDNIINFGE